MSIQSLLKPNGYDLFANSITASNGIVIGGDIFYHTLTQIGGGNTNVDATGNIHSSGQLSFDTSIETLGPVTANGGFITRQDVQASGSVISSHVQTITITATDDIKSIIGQINGATFANSNSGFHVTNSGDVFAHSINAPSITTSGNLVVHGSITADGSIISLSGVVDGLGFSLTNGKFSVSDVGDVTCATLNVSGDVLAKSILLSTFVVANGDIESLSGHVEANTFNTSNSGFVVTTSGDIIAHSITTPSVTTSGNLTVHGTITADSNIISLSGLVSGNTFNTSNSGFIVTNSGLVTASGSITAGTTIAANNTITSNSGSIRALGGFLQAPTFLTVGTTATIGQTLDVSGAITGSTTITANGNVTSNSGSIVGTTIRNPGSSFTVNLSGEIIAPVLQRHYNFSLSGTSGNNYAFPFNANITLSGTHVLGQILNVNTSGGAVTLTLPNPSVVFTAMAGVPIVNGYYFDFTISNFGTGVNAVTLATSGDAKFTVASTSTPANSVRNYKCTIVDSTGTATPSLVCF
jgi:hypothetical protein